MQVLGQLVGVQVGFILGSIWDQFGIGVGSVWASLGSDWDKCQVSFGSVLGRIVIGLARLLLMNLEKMGFSQKLVFALF